jgi:hypothetical protein
MKIKKKKVDKSISNMSARDRLKEIKIIIEAVDNRCMSHDGPVGKTLDEMTQEEMSRIWKLSGG